MRRTAVFPVLLLLPPLLAGACVGLRADPRGGLVWHSAPELGWQTKAIVAKRAPETLLASDGTICRVAKDRFRDTAVGAAVKCNWQ